MKNNQDLLYLAIDPGVETCGLAVVEFFADGTNSLLLYCENAYAIIKRIETLKPSIVQVFIEDNNSITAIYEGRITAKDNERTKLAKAQSVGKVKAIQLVIQQACEALGIEFVLVSPDTRHRVPEKRKDVGPFLQMYNRPTKTTAPQFEFLLKVWGISPISFGRFSALGVEDSRDAATLLQPIFEKYGTKKA